MAPVSVHPPDPNSPKGMAWILGVGMVDPRPGQPNQVMAITQSWEPTSELWWALGVRWHPELATKWAVGGGQFAVAEIVNEKPDIPEQQTMEQAAEEILAFIGEEHPEYAALLQKIHNAGTPAERAEIAKQYEAEVKKLIILTQYINSKE
ncbi:Uncharacterised protein [Mycobacteroides abscessus subsp. massiliense]|nr:hypothetical protein [Mycobacteroides abscessus]SKM17717.1 Uncharacterised protein [Mycobacteroides abscessus subsp. massiliense]MDM2426923.1 hypothetical protein [Mycobacteroides abscessus]MDM2431747.1 hypothetical protein [Mycobacteroides abscessus]MDM2436640.1 hypothetical protein [Mycobacteroides abscessus]